MSSATKVLDSLRGSPLGHTLPDLQVVARHRGLTWRHKGASHCIFIRADGRTLSVPAARPIKPVYIRMFLALVDGE